MKRFPRVRTAGAVLALGVMGIGLVWNAGIVGAGQSAQTYTDAEQLARQAAEELQLFAEHEHLDLAAARQYVDLTPDVHALADRAGVRYPDTFAGIARNPADGNQVRVLFKGGAGVKLAAIAGSFPHPELLVAQDVPNSLLDLTQVLATVNAEVGELGRSGVQLASAGIDLGRNRVSIGMLRPSAQDRAQLEQRYGATHVDVRDVPVLRPTAVVPDACPNRQTCTPYLKGGVEITDNQSGTCSSAFNGTNSTGQKVMFTSGHCFPVGNTVQHAKVSVGAVTGRVYGGSADAEMVPFTTAVWRPSNWIYFSEGNKQYVLTGKDGTNFTAAAGDPICRTGRTTGAVCGTLLRTNVTISIDNGDGTVTQIANMRESNICALPGDSGGPFVWNGGAYGITSSSNFVKTGTNTYACNASPLTYFAGVPFIEAALGAHVRL